MNPDILAQVYDAVSSKSYLTYEPESKLWSVWERMLSWLFPPHELHEIGPVDGSSLGYAYRLSRTEGYERNIAEVNLAVKIEPVGRTPDGEPIYAVEGQAEPVYQPGTRESRMAQLKDDYDDEAPHIVENKPMTKRKFPYSEAARLWSEGKTNLEIATALGYLDEGRKDNTHTLRVFLTKMHKGYPDGNSNIVKLPYRRRKSEAG